MPYRFQNLTIYNLTDKNAMLTLTLYDNLAEKLSVVCHPPKFPMSMLLVSGVDTHYFAC